MIVKAITGRYLYIRCNCSDAVIFAAAVTSKEHSVGNQITAATCNLLNFKSDSTETLLTLSFVANQVSICLSRVSFFIVQVIS